MAPLQVRCCCLTAARRWRGAAAGCMATTCRQRRLESLYRPGRGHSAPPPCCRLDVYRAVPSTCAAQPKVWCSRAGAVALAHALTENSTLEKLVVSDNYVGALGGGAIATAVGRNSGLTDLRLKGCELGDSVLQRLCDALAVRPAPACSALCEVKSIFVTAARAAFIHVKSVNRACQQCTRQRRPAPWLRSNLVRTALKYTSPK